ncbi:MAG TPA: hypothetical protein VF142_18730, partial [Longimicrobium sp.]
MTLCDRPRGSGVYRFSFDFEGQPALPGVQAPSMVQETAWEVQAAFIGRVDAAVQELAGPGVDLARLAGTFRVLPASPEWVAVERSRASLENAARFRRPPPGPDVDVVRAYTALLEQSGELIALAIVCGSLVGRVGRPGDPPPQWAYAGLVAIEALALDGTHPPLEVLRALRAEAVRPVPGGLGAPLGADAPPALGPQTLEAWKRWIASRQLLLPPGTFSPDFVAVRARAWDAWLQRFRTGAAPVADVRATVGELVCRVADVTPASLVAPRLSSMSLEDWSVVLARSLADTGPADPAYVPSWMALPALRALGLGAQAAALVPLLRGEPPVSHVQRPHGREIPGVRELAERTTVQAHPPERSFLVVRQAPPTRKWMPADPPPGAVLALSLADLRGLAASPPPYVRALLSGFGHLVLDSDAYEAVQQETNEVLRPLARDLLSATKTGEAELLRKAEEQERTGQSPLDRLMSLVAPPAPDASLYARLAAANGYNLPPGLAAFLAAPRRIARGKLRVEMSPPRSFGAGTLRRLGVPVLGTEIDCRYEGNTVTGALDGREQLILTLGRALELKADHWPQGAMLAHEGETTEA